MTRLVSTFVLLPLMALAGCHENQHSVNSATDLQTDQRPSGAAMTDLQTLTGTLVYQPQEGGFLGFVTTDGNHYLLRNLEKPYRKNGMKLTIKGKPVEGIATTKQFGTPFAVTEIVQIDATNVSLPSNEM